MRPFLCSVSVLVCCLMTTPAGADVIGVFSPALLSSRLTVVTFEEAWSGVEILSSDSTRLAAEYSGGLTTSGVFGMASRGRDEMIFDFLGTVTEGGLYFGNDDPRCCGGPFTAHLSLFTGSTWLGEVALVANMNDYVDQFLGFSSTEPVTRARLRYGIERPTNHALFVDDLMFGTPTAVPEPASVLLLALGLALVVRVRQTSCTAAQQGFGKTGACGRR